MGYMGEYIQRKLSAADLEKELLRLLSEYNKLRQTFVILYVAAMNKRIPELSLNQDDYYLIHDLLKDVSTDSVDFYIETPGGSGESAEEIVRCLRSKFANVSFVVSGEAKSAGTIMVLSADDILMTNTGSLGPIDAQVRIGRSMVSAYDYVEWAKQKSQQAKRHGALNPFDATMIAQISPGELSGVYHALKYAEDLVVDWLVRYKFKNWEYTETRNIPVTDEMKIRTAKGIAKELTNHRKWRTHGRSIKADDLSNIGLQITKVEDDAALSDIVYRIQTVCRLLFGSTSIYKIFATEEEKIFKHAVSAGRATGIPGSIVPEVVEMGVKCPQCGKSYKLYAKLVDNPNIDKNLQKQGSLAYPKNNKLKCECGFEVDLSGIRNEIETNTGSKLIV